MPALTEGRSFQQASAQLPAEYQASARDLLGILQDHGLMVATATRSLEPAPLPDGLTSDLSLVVTGDEALSTGLAAVLEQCGLNVGMSAATAGGNALLCHVAANDDGLCWSFADVRSKTPAALPLAAFRRAASFGATRASWGGLSVQISPEALTAVAARQIARRILRPSGAQPPTGTVTFLDRRTLRTSTHYVTVHPYDAPADQRTQGEFWRDQRDPHNGPSLSQHELPSRWQRLSDQRFGAFAELDDTLFR